MICRDKTPHGNIHHCHLNHLRALDFNSLWPRRNGRRRNFIGNYGVSVTCDTGRSPSWGRAIGLQRYTFLGIRKTRQLDHFRLLYTHYGLGSILGDTIVVR